MPLPNILADPNSPARVFAAGAPFYLDGREALESNVFNTAAGVTLSIALRMLTLDGQIIDQLFTHTPTTNGARSQQRFQLCEGWILNAQVFASAGAPTGATCVCVLRVVLGTTANAQSLGVLAQGAITQAQELSWPVTAGNAAVGLGATNGTPRVIVGTNPAPGVEVSETVPAGVVWRIISFIVGFTTSAAVANRVPTITFDDGANVFMLSEASQPIAASLTRNLLIGDSTFQLGANPSCLWWSSPANVRLFAGCRIRTSTVALQAGDDYTAPNYAVEEWRV